MSTQKVELQTPAKLLSLLEELERLDDSRTLDELKSPVYLEDSRTVRLARAASTLDRLLRDLSETEKKAVTESLQFKALPPHTQWPRQEHLPEPLRIGRKPDKGPVGRGDLAESRERRAPKLRVKLKVFVEPK